MTSAEQVAHQVLDDLIREFPMEPSEDSPRGQIIFETLQKYITFEDVKPSYFNANYLLKPDPEESDIVWVMRHKDKTKPQAQIYIVGWWKANGEFGGVPVVLYYGYSDGKKNVAPYSGWNWRKNLIQDHWGRYPPEPEKFQDWDWFSKAFGEPDGMGNVSDNPWEKFEVKFMTIPVGISDYPKVLNWTNDSLRQIFK
tara:strand:+ start:10364 stop:10954 length:591 start_codon:yes stop_codon:yes gene_type:complete